MIYLTNSNVLCGKNALKSLKSRVLQIKILISFSIPFIASNRFSEPLLKMPLLPVVNCYSIEIPFHLCILEFV